jgi:hypothetical protein
VLRIFALGPSRVEKEGQPLTSNDWIQKPRELLFYLLSQPPAPKSRSVSPSGQRLDDSRVKLQSKP